MDNSMDIPVMLEDLQEEFYIVNENEKELHQTPSTGPIVTNHEQGGQRQIDWTEAYQDLSSFANQQEYGTMCAPNCAQRESQMIASTDAQQNLFDLRNNLPAQQQLADLAEMRTDQYREENASILEEPSNSDYEMLDSEDDDNFVVPKLSRSQVARLTEQQKFQRRKDLNRAAAAKSRRKKRDKTKTLEKELKRLMENNKKFKEQIRELELEKLAAITEYQRHMKHCTCPLNFLGNSTPSNGGSYA